MLSHSLVIIPLLVLPMLLFFNTFVCHLVNLEYKQYIFCSFHPCSPFSFWDLLLLVKSSPTIYVVFYRHSLHNLNTSCIPCMSDIIAHTDISTRTSWSNVKANKLDVNDTQLMEHVKAVLQKTCRKMMNPLHPQGPCSNLACDMGTTCI